MRAGRNYEVPLADNCVIDVHFEDGEGADRFVYDVRNAGRVAGIALHS